jgi:hypothetical protein
MTNHEAWLYAASWGSLVRSGDPGACMYGFDENFIVQSEDHRQRCLNHVEQVCKPMVVSNPDEYDENELEQLDNLISKLREAAVQ